jgi:glycerol uptake facilitator-like aquaporin
VGAGALQRRLVAEFLGTCLLLVAVVGSGVAAQRMSPNDLGLQLLESSLATGAALAAIILALGTVSGAHLNPVVTLAERVFGGISTVAAGGYIAAQLLGGLLGTMLANMMFSLAAVDVSRTTRGGSGLWLGELVATFGLLLVLFGVARSALARAVPFAVAAYIGAAYWFTSSTSFANPAATLARMLTDTFAGIAPRSAPAFVLAELAGAGLAIAAIAILFPPTGPLPVTPAAGEAGTGDHHAGERKQWVPLNHRTESGPP